MLNSTPTIFPNAHFNADISADNLHKYMAGWGCDKDKIVSTLVTCSNGQRQELAHAFKLRYGKDVKEELKSELCGDLETLALALMEPPADYDARQVHRAMSGPGTKESVLIEILTTRTNAQIYALKYRYRALYGAELEKDLVSDTSGHFRRVLVALSTAGRDESMRVDADKARQDAIALFEAGENHAGTDESAFITALVTQNAHQLRALFDAYALVAGGGGGETSDKAKAEGKAKDAGGKAKDAGGKAKDAGGKARNAGGKTKPKLKANKMECAIKAEFSGDVRDALIALVKCARGRSAFFARLIHKAMKGMGTRDSDLIRLVVSRAEIDLADVRDAYRVKYKTTLEAAIAAECSGAYRDALVALVKGN